MGRPPAYEAFHRSRQARRHPREMSGRRLELMSGRRGMAPASGHDIRYGTASTEAQAHDGPGFPQWLVGCDFPAQLEPLRRPGGVSAYRSADQRQQQRSESVCRGWHLAPAEMAIRLPGGMLNRAQFYRRPSSDG